MTKIYLVRTSLGCPEDQWPDCVTANRPLAIEILGEVSQHGASAYEHWINVYDSETGKELKDDPDSGKQFGEINP